jgi:multiple sugar transport system permease protein
MSTTSLPAAEASGVRTIVQQQATTRRILFWGAVMASLWIVVPLYLLVINAFSSPEAIDQFPKSFLPEGDLGSLQYLLEFQGVLAALANSLIVAAMTMVASIGLGAPAGYALARYEFRGKGTFRMLIMLTRAFPLP